VAHHLADPAAFLHEAFRVLKVGGMLCVVTDDEDIIRARFPLAEYFPETVAADLARYPSVEALRAFASVAGFNGWRETRVTTQTSLTSATPYEAKSFSVLHLISAASFEAGLARLRKDLERGPLTAVGSYALLWATT
jgi:SAM-dependent methyltransferase